MYTRIPLKIPYLLKFQYNCLYEILEKGLSIVPLYNSFDFFVSSLTSSYSFFKKNKKNKFIFKVYYMLQNIMVKVK